MYHLKSQSTFPSLNNSIISFAKQPSHFPPSVKTISLPLPPPLILLSPSNTSSSFSPVLSPPSPPVPLFPFSSHHIFLFPPLIFFPHYCSSSSIFLLFLFLFSLFPFTLYFSLCTYFFYALQLPCTNTVFREIDRYR